MDRPDLTPHDRVGNRVQTQKPRQASCAPGKPEPEETGNSESSPSRYPIQTGRWTRQAGGDSCFLTGLVKVTGKRAAQAPGRQRQHQNLRSTSNPNGAQRRAGAWGSGPLQVGHGGRGTERPARVPCEQAEAVGLSRPPFLIFIWQTRRGPCDLVP